jgi:hypothetical protein
MTHEATEKLGFDIYELEETFGEFLELARLKLVKDLKVRFSRLDNLLFKI